VAVRKLNPKLSYSRKKDSFRFKWWTEEHFSEPVCEGVTLFKSIVDERVIGFSLSGEVLREMMKEKA